MRLAFFGTPDFAVPTLEALARHHEVVLVVAQPDKPAGRGMKMQAPPVIVKARELGLTVAQPVKIRTAEFLDSIRAIAPEVGVVVAYGRILPAALLEIPARGFLNIHGSILPKYRGAAPIQRAIEHGEKVTGVTIMRVDEELDHGPMLRVAATDIGPDERTPALARRLAEIGAKALLDVLRDWPAETPQDHQSATIAPKIEKSESRITFEEPAATIYNRFRAFDPWPGITFGELKLTDIAVAEGSATPGTILSIDDSVVVAAGEGAIRINELQRPGKPRTAAGAGARGLGWRVGERAQ
jgi:methionyl-tRNA formyltransferase